MAELNIFHYLPGESALHRMDGRIKLICMILLSIVASITIRILDLEILSLILLIALFYSKLPIRKLFTELRYFLFLIILVIVVHSFSIPGTPLTTFPLFNPTWEGLRSGMLFSWRIILLVSISMILTATTTLSSLKNVIEWLLRPIPFIPENKVAMMISLTFTLIPLIFDQASEMMDAQKARCIAGRKNPISRIVFLVFPLLLQTFKRADELVDAMESRCYSEERTPVVFRTKPSDWLLLLLTGLVCCMVLVKF
jgi:biotin transport system permease protein